MVVVELEVVVVVEVMEVVVVVGGSGQWTVHNS